MRVGNRWVTMEGVLRYLSDVGEVVFPTPKTAFKQMLNPKYFEIEDYFPSVVERVIGRLARKGWVEKLDTKDGTKVFLTENGRRQVLIFDAEKFEPKREKWDGRWRLVIFDVEESKRRKRKDLRRYLQKLGFWQMQKSVWINPFDCEKEIRYLREILDVPSEVKWIVAEKIENEEELKKNFGLR